MDFKGRFVKVSVDPIACFKEGWQLIQRDTALFVISTVLIAIVFGIASLIPFAGLLVSGPLVAGFYHLVIKAHRGATPAYSDLTAGFNYLAPLVLATFVTSIITSLGFLLFVLPGIYFAIAYGMTTLIIFDQGLRFWQGMETSRQLITTHFGDYFAFVLLALVLNIVAAIPAGLGLLISIPLTLAAQYCFYRRVMDQQTEAFASQLSVSALTPDD
jgi:uncharacterized membrane protein